MSDVKSKVRSNNLTSYDYEALYALDELCAFQFGNC